MIQFLISYWWLFILAVIIVALIMKNIVKLVISILVLVAVFILFWTGLVSPGLSRSTKCFTIANESLNTTSQKAAEMVQSERKKFMCSEDAVNYQNLTNCLKASKIQNGLGFAVYSSMPQFNKTINETVTSHNDLCPETPLKPPVF